MKLCRESASRKVNWLVIFTCVFVVLITYQFFGTSAPTFTPNDIFSFFGDSKLFSANKHSNLGAVPLFSLKLQHISENDSNNNSPPSDMMMSDATANSPSSTTPQQSSHQRETKTEEMPPNFDLLHQPPFATTTTTTTTTSSSSEQRNHPLHVCHDFEKVVESELEHLSVVGVGKQEVAMAFACLTPGKRAVLVINSTGTFLYHDPLIDVHIKRCFNGFVQTFSFQNLQNKISRITTTSNNNNNKDATLVMVINLHASDIKSAKRLQTPLPVFSYSKSLGDYDILIPRPYFAELFLQQQSILSTIPKYGLWENKKNIAVFRGVLTHHLREDLYIFSLNHPHLVNATITGFDEEVPPQRSNLILLGPHTLLIDDLLEYKYVFYIDGHGTADRLPKLLAADTTTVLMASTPDTHNLQMELLGMPGRPTLLLEFFYSFLKPHVHFHPFKTDLSDLEDQLLYLRTHDEYAKNVAANGAKFVKQRLTRAKVKCYFEELATRYFKLQRDDGADILNEILIQNPLLNGIRFKFCDPLVLGELACRMFSLNATETNWQLFRV